MFWWLTVRPDPGDTSAQRALGRLLSAARESSHPTFAHGQIGSAFLLPELSGLRAHWRKVS